MPKQERFLPPKIGRFNYWKYFTPQRWRQSVREPMQDHIRQQFHLLLNASTKEWNREIFPVHGLRLEDIPNRKFFALTVYAEDDKEWEQDGEACNVYRQLSSDEKEVILRLSKKKWHHRSQWNWDTLLQTIARDQDVFAEYCKCPPKSGNIIGTEHRLYVTYSQEAMWLLGGGKIIPKHRRDQYPGLLDKSGRLPSASIFPTLNWGNCLSREDKRIAKLHTLHWFQHALRNMQEYRNKRPPVPWSPECVKMCGRIQQKLCNKK